MFRIVLTILTAATFVAHGLFGCCWHHGHAHMVSAAAQSKHAVHCNEHGRHRHSHHDLERQGADHIGGHDPHPPHDGQCDKAECVFFARVQDGPQVSSDLLIASAFVLATGTVDSTDVQGVGITACTAHDGISSSSAPHCALSQVWLI